MCLRLHLAVAIILAVAPQAIATEPATESIEIPLKDIWGYSLPGTRDINELVPTDRRDTILHAALHHIRDNWRHEKGMVVQGEGVDALESFHRIRVDRLSRNSVSPNSPISLIFFTKLCGRYVRLVDVSRQGNRIAIRYRFEPHETANSSQHLAVIPLGKLARGKYRVRMEKMPMESKYVELKFPDESPELRNSVSGSFEFSVF